MTTSAQAADTPLKTATQVEGGPITEGFQLTARAEKESVKAGEGVVLILTLKSVAVLNGFYESTPVQDYSASAKLYYSASEKPEDSEKVLATTFAETVLTLPFSGRSARWLKGGQELTYKLVVNRLIDMSRTGTYAITVSRPVLKGVSRKELQKQDADAKIGKTSSIDVLLVSNTVRVKIVEPNFEPSVAVATKQK